MMSNLPDDWNCYWQHCERCGVSFHAADGGCDCLHREAESAFEDMAAYFPPGAKPTVDDDDEITYEDKCGQVSVFETDHDIVMYMLEEGWIKRAGLD